MEIAESVEAVWRARRELSGELGLVPTMGALHAGHLALVEQARRECGRVWVSIFVNPLQFGPTEDLARYPRDLAADLALLRAAGVALAFTPSVEIMYPVGFASTVMVGPIAARLEGERRPGHFQGVATVVSKLFVVTRPTRAYFGQKDAQQLRVIQRVTADLGFDLTIVPVETVREADGLALSSRNRYLGPAERRAASVLVRALRMAYAAWRAGERDATRLRHLMEGVIKAEPLARIDYVSIADDRTLEELQQLDGPALASMAVFIGQTRLIDNCRLAEGAPAP